MTILKVLKACKTLKPGSKEVTFASQASILTSISLKEVPAPGH